MGGAGGFVHEFQSGPNVVMAQMGWRAHGWPSRSTPLSEVHAWLDRCDAVGASVVYDLAELALVHVELVRRPRRHPLRAELVLGVPRLAPRVGHRQLADVGRQLVARQPAPAAP